MNKRILSAILVLVILASSFSACSTGKEDENTSVSGDSDTAESSAEETGTQRKDDLPELDYKGEQIHILGRAFERYKDELTVDELTGDIVNDAVYDRAAVVQNRLNIEIVNQKEAPENSHGPIEMIKSTILAGDASYDLYVGSMYNSMSESVNGFWKNLNTVENLDLTKPYWSTYFSEKASIGDKLYAITGDLAFSMIRLLGVTFYNIQLAEDYGITDLYSTVRNGNWTFDYEYSIVKDVYTDLNGDGKSGREDFFGLLTSNTFSVDAYTSSFDLQMIAKDSENYPVIAVDIEKFSAAVEKIHRMCWETTGVLTYEFYGQDDEMNDMAKDFSEDRAIFMNNWLFSTETEYLRNMKSDYGILPYPKYDENQKDYYSYANDQFSVFVIPKTVSDERTPMIGAFLEAMCSESKETVLESYYETALKSKYSRDSESAEMLDIIVSGFKLDPAWMYCVNTSYFAHQMVRTQIWNKSNTVASSYAKSEKVYRKSLEKLVSKFKELEE